MKKNVYFIVLVVFIFASCKFDEENEPEVTEGYYDPSLLNTGLPIIQIDTEGNQSITSKETYLNASIIITDPNDSANNMEAATGIRGRGNSTWGYPKKPYRLKFPEKQSLFGYTRAKSWVLLANYRDPTLMMNSIAFEIGRRFNFPFTNHYIPIELVLNGVYVGSYLLTEQIQVGNGRVDIDEDDGFLVEMDFYYDEEPKFKTDIIPLPFMIKSPEDLANQSDYDFVKNDLNRLVSALFSEDFPENGYRELINMDTFVDYILINDILMNWELQVPASVYMYKDSDAASRINMGPLWDFDCGFGYAGSGRAFFKKYTGRIPNFPDRDGYVGQQFFRKFFEDPIFCEKYKERWNEKYVDINEVLLFIDTMANTLDKSQDANYTVWQFSNTVNYEAEITNMKMWLRNRIEYLNGEINRY
jgi:hypothetical protein